MWLNRSSKRTLLPWLEHLPVLSHCSHITHFKRALQRRTIFKVLSGHQILLPAYWLIENYNKISTFFYSKLNVRNGKCFQDSMDISRENEVHSRSSLYFRQTIYREDFNEIIPMIMYFFVTAFGQSITRFREQRRSLWNDLGANSLPTSLRVQFIPNKCKSDFGLPDMMEMPTTAEYKA